MRNIKKYLVVVIAILLLTGCKNTKTVGNVNHIPMTVSTITKDESMNDEEQEEVIEEETTIGEEVKDTVVTNEEQSTITSKDTTTSTNNGDTDTTSTNPYTSNNTTNTTPTTTSPTTETPAQPTTPTPVEPPKETPNYQYGNSGRLFDTEAEAYAEAEQQRKTFDDGIKYIERYWVWSTYDRWTIEYKYTYWQ